MMMMIMTVMLVMMMVVRPCQVKQSWTAFPTAGLLRAFRILKCKGGKSPRGGCPVQNFLNPSLIMEQPVNISHMVQGTLNLSTQNEGPR